MGVIRNFAKISREVKQQDSKVAESGNEALKIVHAFALTRGDLPFNFQVLSSTVIRVYRLQGWRSNWYSARTNPPGPIPSLLNQMEHHTARVNIALSVRTFISAVVTSKGLIYNT